MSFVTDLHYIMKNDSSLNTYCVGGINFENLPENWEIIKDWIIYSFNKASQQNCMNSSEVFTTYNIVLKIVATDTLKLETINNYVVDYLNNKTYNGIQDINFVSDIHTLDLDKNIYMNTLNFDAIYV